MATASGKPARLPQKSGASTNKTSRRLPASTSPKRESQNAPVKQKDKPAGQNEALSKTRIVDAAIEQIDRNGLMGFSLRDVARTLGVYPAAVYWHVPTRDALLAAVVESTMEDVAPPLGKGTWQDWFRELFSRYRKAVKRHPNVAQLVGAQLVSNGSLSPQMIDRILSMLVSAGCGESKIVEMYNVVVATMVGFVTLEFASLPSDDPANWAAQLQEKTHAIRALEFPTLARHLPAMANKAFIVRWQSGTDAPMDSSFVAFIEVAIAGMEQVLSRQ